MPLVKPNLVYSYRVSYNKQGSQPIKTLVKNVRMVPSTGKATIGLGFASNWLKTSFCLTDQSEWEEFLSLLLISSDEWPASRCCFENFFNEEYLLSQEEIASLQKTRDAVTEELTVLTSKLESLEEDSRLFADLQTRHKVGLPNLL